MTPSDIEKLIERVEALPDAGSRGAALDLVKAVMGLHSEALARMLEIIAGSAPEAGRALAADETVARVLALHGLHPDDFDARLGRAMNKLQIWFDSRGARIELVEAAPELVRLRITTARRGSGGDARRAVEDAIYEAVPEIAELVIDGAEEAENAGFVPLESLVKTA